MTGRFSLTRPARPEHLRALVGVGVEAAEAAGASADVRHAIRLAVEEVCTNVMMHGYGESGSGPVTVEATFDEREIVVRISDEAPVLDLESVPLPDTAAPANDRPIGGLGWYFVHAVMDRVTQQGTGETGNVFVLTKRYG